MAFTPHAAICRQRQFCHGILPEHEAEMPESWNGYTQAWARRRHLDGDLMLLAEGPSSKNPQANHRMEIIELKRP